MNYGTLFSVLEAGGPRSGGRHGRARARSGSRILPVSSRGGERQGSPGRFYRGVTLLTRAPRGLPTEHHFWGQDFSINVGGGDTEAAALSEAAPRPPIRPMSLRVVRDAQKDPPQRTL